MSHVSHWRAEIRELRLKLQKPKAQEEPWAWYVMRPISIYITWALVRTPVSAHQVTLGMLVVTLLSAGGMVMGGTGALLGAFGFQVAYLFDCVDGELARAKGTVGRVGQYLDYITHYVQAIVIPFAVAIRLASESGEMWILVLAVVVVIGFVTDLTFGDLVYKVLFEEGSVSNSFIRKPLKQEKKWHRLLALFPVKGYVYKLLPFYIYVLVFEIVGLLFGSQWTVLLLKYLIITSAIVSVIVFAYRIIRLVRSGIVEERRWAARL